MGDIHLKVITHEKVVFEGEVESIVTRGTNGEFGILPNHTPFMTALTICVTKIIVKGNPMFFTTIGGVLQFTNNRAVILTEDAENGTDIDLVAAKSEKEKLEARYGNADLAKENERADKALATALARFKAAIAAK